GTGTGTGTGTGQGRATGTGTGTSTGWRRAPCSRAGALPRAQRHLQLSLVPRAALLARPPSSTGEIPLLQHLQEPFQTPARILPGHRGDPLENKNPRAALGRDLRA
uniref:Uncharacterized protein n=1 Tax=Serinus canaria TaxID=9135 RepID=A0A8C9KSU2_SERCA